MLRYSVDACCVAVSKFAVAVAINVCLHVARVTRPVARQDCYCEW